MDLQRIARCSARSAFAVTRYISIKLLDALTFACLFTLLNLPNLFSEDGVSSGTIQQHGVERVTIRLLPNTPEPGRSTYYNIRRGWIPYGRGQAIWVITNDVEYSQIVSDDDCAWRAESHYRDSIDPLFWQEGWVTRGRANRCYGAHTCIFTTTIPIPPNEFQTNR